MTSARFITHDTYLLIKGVSAKQQPAFFLRRRIRLLMICIISDRPQFRYSVGIR
jgi:hypothetical protein